MHLNIFEIKSFFYYFFILIVMIKAFHFENQEYFLHFSQKRPSTAIIIQLNTTMKFYHVLKAHEIPSFLLINPIWLYVHVMWGNQLSWTSKNYFVLDMVEGGWLRFTIVFFLNPALLAWRTFVMLLNPTW